MRPDRRTPVTPNPPATGARIEQRLARLSLPLWGRGRPRAALAPSSPRLRTHPLVNDLVARPSPSLVAALSLSLVAALSLSSAGCATRSDPTPSTTSTPDKEVSSSATSTLTSAASGEPAAATIPSPPPAPARDQLTLVAGGDACFGRLVGQEILKNPAFNPFESSARIAGPADVRFVNLESQLSDQKGETQSPTMKLKFTGPPGGADALARGRIDIVSTANNHMWDYGKAAFFETLANLERAGVKYVGAGHTREQAYSPVVVEAGGLRIAFVAFTGIWNQGGLEYHEGRDHVAKAGREAAITGVKAARALAGVDFVVVSYHGGEEYVSVPLQLAIDLHRATIDAGADAVIGHHPHVTQAVEVYKGKPIFYSLGNYVMRMHGTHLETEIGYLARITFSKSAPPAAWVCPFRVAGVVPRPVLLADDPRRDIYERMFRQRVRVTQGSIVSPAKIGSTEEDGCARVSGP